MDKIIERIFELIGDEETSYQTLVDYLKLSHVSVIYAWKRGESFPATNNLIKMSEFYGCSLDYLLNRTDDYGKCSKKQTVKFYDRLEEIIKNKKVKKIVLEKEKICSSNNLFKWKNMNSVPNVATLIKLADYFNVTIDYLLGRE